MPKLKTILFFILFFVLTFFGSFLGSKYLNSKENSTQTSASEVIILDTLENNERNNLQTPDPTPILVLPSKTKPQSQISPEGKMLLSLEASDSSYKLYTNQENSLDESETKKTTNKELVFSGQLGKNEKIELPFNTWSPDNKYFFVKKITNSTEEFLVFKSDGELFDNEQTYINVTQLFLDNEYKYELKDVTGWASNAFLIVQTKDDGPSYWFNVYNSKFIQLSTHF